MSTKIERPAEDLIGQEAIYSPPGDLFFKVRIRDIRNAYGRFELQVEPVAGGGLKWVTAKTVKVEGWTLV